MVAKITSYAVGPALPADSSSSSSSSGSGSGAADVVNEVLFEYNDFGQPVAEYQEHDGVVSMTTSPKVGYSYTDGTGGHTRRTQVVYPNGRILRYEYDSDADDAVNRPTVLADDDDGAIGTQLAEYSYLGLGHIVRVDYPEPGLRYDLAHGTGADPYAGLDRFGRVVDLLWHRTDGSSSSGQTETDVVRIRHGYDRAGNRLWREDPVAASYGKHFDELYAYDGIYRLKNFDRGDLNAGKTAISGTPVWEEDFSLDPLGNWSHYVQKTSGTTGLDQDRTHNKVNEITDVTETTGTAWITPAHDAAGNMTTVPKPSSPANGLICKYDAWNRLVEVTDDETVVAKYEYDGLGRRIKKHLDSQSPAEPNGIDNYIHYFYNGVQVVETRDTTTESDEPEDLQPVYQYLWSPRYIDAPILRDENTGTDGLCDDARIYYLSDANFNVTCLVDTNGDAEERYLYDPYGRVTIYDGTWSNPGSSSNENNTILYTGRELDFETGLYYYRARYYSAELGRFVSRDSVGYRESMGLYQYVRSGPTTRRDPSGHLCEQKCPMNNMSKSVTITDVRLKNRMSANDPGTADFTIATEELLLLIEQFGDATAGGLPGASQVVDAIVTSGQAALEGATELGDAIMQTNGAAMWFEVSGKCCEFEWCYHPYFLLCRQRLDWQDKTFWHKCTERGDNIDSALPGFRLDDGAGMAAAIPACVIEATGHFACP